MSALPPHWWVQFVPVNLQYMHRSFYHLSSASAKNPPQAKYTQNNFTTINTLVLTKILR